MVKPRVGSPADLAQALALACHKIAQFGLGSPDGAGIEWDAAPNAGLVGLGTPAYGSKL